MATSPRREERKERYLMNGLSNLDETYREYSLAPTDDLIRLWKSKVKVTAGCRGGEVLFFFGLLLRFCPFFTTK